MTVPYAELHCVSNFTFLRGASHPRELVQQAHALGYRALAITDECSMAGIVRAYEAARELDCKLIVGAELVTPDCKLVALAATQRAYAQICALITLGRRRSTKGEYRLTRVDFDHSLDDCLMLWVPGDAPTLAQALWFKDTFPNRGWIAVELHRGANDAERLVALQHLAQQTQLPLVATGDVHMHVRERQRLQDVVTAIRHGCTVSDAGFRLYPNAERHLRTYAELAELYPRTLLDNTLEIAERCTFSLDQLNYRYPGELIPQGLRAIDHLRALVAQGCRKRWPQGVSAEICATLEKELALIEELRYEHFFLTVEDIVRAARQLNILCQGRGSAANSVVCYVLGITEIDPARTQLLFERFISRERNEPPDIDVDFEHERREEVIQYIYTKYGRERTALAATVITYQARSAIRDVGKALGFDLDTVDALAKSRAYWDDWPKFLEHLRMLQLSLAAPRVRQLYELVRELVHFPRHLSQHVGGFVVSDQPLSELVPIENAAMPERTVIQWDKNDLETLGLLKVDVLALGMLTALHRTFDFLKRIPGAPCSMAEIPSDDAPTYDMICRADTVGVFQIESRAQMSMLPRLKPRCYYDLVIQVAIVRPGPIQGGMVHPFLKNRALPPEQIEYPSPELKVVLQRTLGVPIFQEQVMQLAMVAAGFTAGEADQLRRSMASWQRSGTLDGFRQKLIDGMLAKKYTLEFAERIYKQIEGFAEYGFPESHSASFALLSYYSSYLKCHYPAAFFAALINSQPMGFYAPRQLLEAAKRQDVTILPVDAAISDGECTLELDARGQHAIRLGLGLIRGLRVDEIERIVAARQERRYVSIDDLAHRAQLATRAVKSLALAGALHGLSSHRRAAMWSALGVERLPGMLAGLSAAEPAPRLPAPSELEEILADFKHLQLSAGRHPLALIRATLRRQGVLSRKEVETATDGCTVRIAGLVTHLQHPQTANGVVFGSLEDEFGIHNIIVWPQVFERFRYVLLQASVLMVTGKMQNEHGVINVIAEKIEDASHWIALERHSRDFH